MYNIAKALEERDTINADWSNPLFQCYHLVSLLNRHSDISIDQDNLGNNNIFSVVTAKHVLSKLSANDCHANGPSESPRQ